MPRFNHFNLVLARDFRKAARVPPEIPIRVRFKRDETIHVLIASKGEPNYRYYVMEIGSDDDDFFFRELRPAKVKGKYFLDGSRTIRFPFSKEWIALIEKDWEEKTV